MVQIHSPRPISRLESLSYGGKFCFGCEFFCVLGSRFSNPLDATNLSPFNSLPCSAKFTSLELPFWRNYGQDRAFWKKNQKPKLKSGET